MHWGKHKFFNNSFSRRDTNSSLKLCNTPLHLKQASVCCVGVVVEHLDLAVNLFMSLLLVCIFSLDLLRKLVLLIQRLILALYDVHLKDSSTCVLLCTNNLHLASVVLDFRDYVDQDLLEALKLSAERHIFLALQSKDGLRPACTKSSIRSNLAVVAARVLKRFKSTTVDSQAVDLHRLVLACNMASCSCFLTSPTHMLHDVWNDGLTRFTCSRHKNIFRWVSVCCRVFKKALR